MNLITNGDALKSVLVEVMTKRILSSKISSGAFIIHLPVIFAFLVSDLETVGGFWRLYSNF